jgi:hypothetical protein
VAEGAAYCQLTPNPFEPSLVHSTLYGNTNVRHRTMKHACHTRLFESSHSGGRISEHTVEIAAYGGPILMEKMLAGLGS